MYTIRILKLLKLISVYAKHINFCEEFFQSTKYIEQLIELIISFEIFCFMKKYKNKLKLHNLINQE